MSFTTKNPLEKLRESRFAFTENGELVVEHAVILWTNFIGKATKFNPDGGRRTFALVLSEEAASILIRAGWNVKSVKGKNASDPTLLITEIAVNPSNSLSVFLCDEEGGKKFRRKVKNEAIGVLDEFQYSDVAALIRPYEHGRSNSAGTTIKGYLHQMNLVRLNEDYFREMFKEYETGGAADLPAEGDVTEADSATAERNAPMERDVPNGSNSYMDNNFPDEFGCWRDADEDPDLPFR